MVDFSTGFAEYEMKPTLYAYNELQKATKNFSADTKLGEGGYGAVYKVLDNFMFYI